MRTETERFDVGDAPVDTDDPYTFQLWWRAHDGRTYAGHRGYLDIESAQRSLRKLHEDMESWDVEACGTSRLECPRDRSKPRPGEKGFSEFTVKAPGDDVEAVFGSGAA